ncbi:trans-sulfuration enzyme family protein [Neobacillus sp. Marseille-QA0830]
MNEFNDSAYDNDICMHFADEPNRFQGAVIPPIYHNTLFVYPTLESLGNAIADETEHYVYIRGTNPTVEMAEEKLAALERGEQCKCVSSGMAAISAALFNSVKSGDHVLCVGNIYLSTMSVIQYLKKFNVNHSVIYSTNIEDMENAILPNTKVMFLECPTDMNYRLVDLKKTAELAKGKGIRTIMDNTWATPFYQKPLTFGIDVVVHSASKYLGGHSDIVGGAIISSKEIMKKLFKDEFLLFGGVMAPYTASQLLRSLRTLPLRLAAHQESALKAAKFLESHPRIATVHYPALTSHPDYELGKKQLTGYTGVFSFDIKNGTYEVVKGIIDKLNIFQIGVSWGSFESLVMSPNYGYNEQKLIKEHVSPGLIRVSIGLEDSDKLIEDLDQALEL